MNPFETESLSRSLEATLLKHQSEHDGSHDVHHARRVKINAHTIASMERKGDEPTLVAAAYLHDLINLPKNHPDRANASLLSADAAAPILTNLGFDTARTSAVQHCILAHSFSANIKPETIEAKILQDADRLESLGALGIARTFYIAGKLDS